MLSSRTGMPDTSDQVYNEIIGEHINVVKVYEIDVFTLLVKVLSSRNLLARIRAVVKRRTSEPIDAWMAG